MSRLLFSSAPNSQATIRCCSCDSLAQVSVYTQLGRLYDYTRGFSGLSEIDIIDIAPNICWVLLTHMWLTVVMENCTSRLVCREMRSLCYVSGAVSDPPFGFVH